MSNSGKEMKKVREELMSRYARVLFMSDMMDGLQVLYILCCRIRTAVPTRMRNGHCFEALQNSRYVDRSCQDL